MVVTLTGCGLLFFAFAVITSNTANILAWGFKGVPVLEKSPFALLVYECVHTTYAYMGFLLGLLLVGLAAVVLFIYGALDEKPARKAFWYIWGLGLVSFISSNVILMLLPAPTYFPQYLNMMITNPAPNDILIVIDPFRHWPFYLPAITALLLFIHKHKTSTRVQCIIQTSPLCGTPFVLTYYLANHYMCYENPDVYSLSLNILTPFLILVPAITFIYFTLKHKPCIK